MQGCQTVSRECRASPTRRLLVKCSRGFCKLSQRRRTQRPHVCDTRLLSNRSAASRELAGTPGLSSPTWKFDIQFCTRTTEITYSSPSGSRKRQHCGCQSPVPAIQHQLCRCLVWTAIVKADTLKGAFLGSCIQMII